MIFNLYSVTLPKTAQRYKGPPCIPTGRHRGHGSSCYDGYPGSAGPRCTRGEYHVTVTSYGPVRSDIIPSLHQGYIYGQPLL